MSGLMVIFRWMEMGSFIGLLFRGFSSIRELGWGTAWRSVRASRSRSVRVVGFASSTGAIGLGVHLQ